mmetsp:Transcript_18530/g.26122  ORF Transcript_18530/g.26122 Transcript_18530/m.26122 type:complete len:389 (+) Transcript_18530:44-1210(+)
MRNLLLILPLILPAFSFIKTSIVSLNAFESKISYVRKYSESTLAEYSQVVKVLDEMNDEEKYNSILQGLAGLASENSKGQNRLNEAMKLLEEMRDRRITCTTRSASMMIDAAANSSDVLQIWNLLSKIRRAGASSKYSFYLNKLAKLPSDKRKRDRIIEKLPSLPIDNRGEDIIHAGAFMGIVGLDFAGDSLAPALHVDTAIPTVLTFATFAAIAYDVLKKGAESSKKVVNGLNRLFLKDLERESRTEAGAFLVGYALGLPCFAFRPNVVEALRMINSIPEIKEAVVNGNGINRILVWLLAPVAGESLSHRQLIASDPRQASVFLDMCRENGYIDSDESEDQSELIFAHNEAREIVKRNERAFDALRQLFEIGNASVGECISLLEKQL